MTSRLQRLGAWPERLGLWALCLGLLLGTAARSDAQGAKPADPTAEAKQHFLKGNQLFKERKFAEAGLEYTRTLELVPTLANPHKNKARCYLALNEEALLPDVGYHLLRYLQLKPDAGDAAQVRVELRQAVTGMGLAGAAGKELAEVSARLEELGTRAAEEEQWALAVRRFEQLRDLQPKRTDLLKLLAESYLGALRCDDASSAYEAYLMVRPAERSDVDLPGLLRECSEEARSHAASSAVPGKLVVLTNVSGAVVLVDGNRVGNTPLDAPLRLSPGDHQIALFKEGYETVSRKASIVSGASSQLDIQLVAFDQDEGAEAPSSAGPAAGAAGGRDHFLLLPELGLLSALGGYGGLTFGPSFRLLAGWQLTERVAIQAQLGYHALGRDLQEPAPFQQAELSSSALPLLAGLGYRHPLGKLRLYAGLGVGVLLTSTTVTGDGGGEASSAGSVIALELEGGAELPLGPGNLVGSLGYLAHPFNTIDLSYRGDSLVENLVLGGLGLHIGYLYSL